MPARARGRDGQASDERPDRPPPQAGAVRRAAPPGAAAPGAGAGPVARRGAGRAARPSRARGSSARSSTTRARSPSSSRRRVRQERGPRRVGRARPAAVRVGLARPGRRRRGPPRRSRSPRRSPVVHPPARDAVTLDDLTWALASLGPAVLAIDGVHALRSDGARRVVAALAEHVPAGATLGLASRAEPPLPLARLRAQDDVVELRADRLAMTRAEAAALLHRAGAAARPPRRWSASSSWPPAGPPRCSSPRASCARPTTSARRSPSFGGDDCAVADYVREEILSELSADGPRLPRRSAVLDRAVRRGLRRRARARATPASSCGGWRRSNVPLAAVDRAQLAFAPPPARRAGAARGAALRRAGARARAAPPRERLVRDARATSTARSSTRSTGARRERVAELLGERAVADIASGRAAAIDGWLARLTRATTSPRIRRSRSPPR